jgi:hypothetical protein
MKAVAKFENFRIFLSFFALKSYGKVSIHNPANYQHYNTGKSTIVIEPHFLLLQ